MKVTIQKRPRKNGRQLLTLNYYSPLLNIKTGKPTRYESLRLLIYTTPSTPEERNHNKETYALAEQIRAKRQLDQQARLHGLAPDHLKQQSFVQYFRAMADRQRGTNLHNWDSSVRYFEMFTGSKDVRFIDLNLTLCERFKFFLKGAPQLRTSRRGIGHNSALSYFNKFRSAVKAAWREKLIEDDLHGMCPGLRELEAEVEYLTMAEVKRLIATPMENEMNRRAVLFSILTGLRFCDIQYLKWDQVLGEPGSYYLQFRQRKTYKPQHVYISDQAFGLLGERDESNRQVFKNIYYNQVSDFLKEWPRKAGIHKHLTFSCLRHTYATLQLEYGTDIYTISKMLGHRHLKTTQRYTRVVDQSKKEAANRIVLFI